MFCKLNIALNFVIGLNSVRYVNNLEKLFDKLIINKDTFLLRSLCIKFTIFHPEMNQSNESRIVSLLTQLTEKTSIKSILISPLCISKREADYIQFWYKYPFGEYVVPKYNKKGICQGKISSRKVHVVKYDS